MLRDAKALLYQVHELTPYYRDSGALSYLAGCLESHYNQTWRAYHNLDHIQSMLERLDAFELFGLEKLEEVVVAILFHDTVYSLRAKSPENEAASADVALTVGPKCLTAPPARESRIDWRLVHSLIMATTHTGLPIDATFEEKLIVDLDLATLSGSFDEYNQVNARVKNEYLTVYSEEEFNSGRVKWIDSMLGRRIYYLEYFNEAEARSNLLTERELLV
jgi:predicted metal-dependent HD superfamily phosphohydrolase